MHASEGLPYGQQHACKNVHDMLSGMQQIDSHSNNMCTQHADMHECESSGDAGCQVNSKKPAHVDNEKIGKKEMMFVDETWNVKKKIKKKQDESLYKRSKLRKILSNKPFLDNYFEYDNSNGVNQVKKFKIVECSQSKIVTSEIIPNLNEQFINSESKSNGEASSEQVLPIDHSNVLESPQTNESDFNYNNINLLLALLYVLTGDSNEQTNL